MSKHYVGETGTSLILDCGILIGSATVYHIKYLKPGGNASGIEGTFTASLYSSYSQLAGAIGTYFLSHSFSSSDLDVPGEWRFQSFVAAVDGTWMGETAKIQIYDEYE